MKNTGVEIDRIREVIKSCQKGCTIAEIARIVRLNRISTSKYLNMMVAAGEAEMHMHGPAKVYYPCQRVPISTILNLTSDILLVMDDSLTIIDANNVLLEYFSVKKADLIGRRIDYSPIGQYVDALILGRLKDAIGSKGSTLNTRQTIDGNEYYFQLKFIPTLFESGDPGVTMLAEDITELSLHRQHLEQLVEERSQELVLANEQLKKEVANYKKARKALKASETKYRDLVQNANSIILKMDTGGIIEFFNEFAQEFFGWNEEEIIGKSIYDTIVPRQRTKGESVENLLRNLEQNPHGITRFENENIKKDGERVWVSWTNKFIRNPDGRITGVLSVGNDITRKKQAEDELKLQNLLLSTQNETTIDGILVVDETNTIISYNQRFIELWGIPRKIIKEKKNPPVLDHICNLIKDPVRFRRKVEEVNKDPGRIIMDEVSLKDGRCFDRYSAPMIGPDNTYYGRIWYFRDITGQKQNEEKIKKSEEKMAGIINFLPDATFVIDTAGKVIAWNRAMEQWTGIRAQEILGLGEYEYAEAIHGFRKPILIDFALNPDLENPGMYESCVRDGNTFTAETFSTYTSHEGIWIWGTASPLYDETETLIGAIESMRDITAIKRTEQALKEREATYAAIVEDQTEMIARLRPDGIYVFVNQAFAALFAQKKEDIVGTRFVPPVVDEELPLLNRYFSGINPSNPVITIEIRMIVYNGDIRWTRWNIRGFFSPEGKVTEYQAVGRDISDFVAAKEAADYQALLLNQVNDAIVATDMAGRITYWNPVAEGLFGWKYREVLGKNIRNLMGFDMFKKDTGTFRDVLMENGVWKGSSVHTIKSGKPVQVEWSVSVFKDRAGTMKGIVGLCREIAASRLSE